MLAPLVSTQAGYQLSHLSAALPSVLWLPSLGRPVCDVLYPDSVIRIPRSLPFPPHTRLP